MKLKITVHGVAYEVDVEVLDIGEGFPSSTGHQVPKARPHQNDGVAPTDQRPAVPAPTGTGPAGGSISSPIGGTVIEIKCRVGESVSQNQVLLVIEAMKMKTSIAAPTNGKINSIPVAVGDNVQESQTLVVLE